MGRIFSSDPITRKVSIFHGSDDGNSFVIETRQDVEDILEVSKAQFARVDERAPWKGEFHHVARIPLTEYFRIHRECMGDEDAMQKALKIWLNDPDNRNYRVRPGRI